MSGFPAAPEGAGAGGAARLPVGAGGLPQGQALRVAG